VLLQQQLQHPNSAWTQRRHRELPRASSGRAVAVAAVFVAAAVLSSPRSIVAIER